MKVIKRHKGLAIVLGLTLVLILIMFAIFARVIFTSGNSEYGDRLKGIIKLDKSVTEKIISETEAIENVEDVSIRVQGKIIYTTIKYSSTMNRDKAIEIANKTLSYYEKDILECYDLGYFLVQNVDTSKEDNTGFIISGTKHPDKEAISWTK